MRFSFFSSLAIPDVTRQNRSDIICLIVQITIIGWIPACIWAFKSPIRMYADRRSIKIIKEMKN